MVQNYTTIYEAYRVISTTVTIDWINGNSAYGGITCGWHKSNDDDASGFNDVVDFYEAKNTYKETMSASGSNGDRTRQVIHYAQDDWDLHVTNVGVESTWTAVGAQPDEPHFLHIGCVNADGGNSDFTDVNAYIYVEQIIQWRDITDAKMLTTSTTTAALT